MNTITDLERRQLLGLHNEWEKIAVKVGPLHAWWDYIFDVRCILAGKPPLLSWNAQQYIEEGRDGLIKYGHWKKDLLEKD